MSKVWSARVLIGGLLAAGGIALGSCDATQPRPLCRAQGSEYGARYTVVGTPPAACNGKILTGEILHLQYYRAAPGDPMPTASLAIEPQSVVEALEAADHPANAGTEYSMGKYTTVEPDSEDLCTAPILSDTSITAGTARLVYKWSNVRMLVKPNANAIHFGADLQRTDGDCTVTYKVSAVNPAHHCGNGKDAMGHPDPTTGGPDPSACNTDPTSGTGLSPEFTYMCDGSPDGTSGTRLCLPSQDFPSFK